MKNKNIYTIRLIGIFIFSIALIIFFAIFSSNKNIKADDIYIHKLTIGNSCIYENIKKLKLDNILITYNMLDKIEEKCK